MRSVMPTGFVVFTLGALYAFRTGENFVFFSNIAEQRGVPHETQHSIIESMIPKL